MGDDPFSLLRQIGLEYRDKEGALSMLREQRDRLALRLVEQGHTWREVADAAGFANPYIAELKRRAALRPVPSTIEERESCEP